MTDSKPSKSARKREQLALQELGEKLIALNVAELDALGLDAVLDEAIRAAGSMKSHGALRRQKQLVGKLMRQVDAEPIRARLAQLSADEITSKRVFAAAERWRDRLDTAGSEAIDAFETATGVADPELRQLVDELQRARDEKTGKTVRRKIFRRIHSILVRIPS